MRYTLKYVGLEVSWHHKAKTTNSKWLNKTVCIYVYRGINLGLYGQWVNRGERYSGCRYFLTLFKLESFLNEKLERREDVLGWRRKAVAGRAGVRLQALSIRGPTSRGSRRQCHMGRWVEANSRKWNIWVGSDLGPASLGILMLPIFVLKTHETLFHFISLFHIQKWRSDSRSIPGPLTPREAHFLACLVHGFLSKAPLHEWFQFFLVNLAVKSQLDGGGRVYLCIQWPATWLILCQVWLCCFYLMLTTQLHTKAEMLHCFSSPAPAPVPPAPDSNLYSWHPALAWWVLGGPDSCFVPRSKAATALNW